MSKNAAVAETKTEGETPPVEEKPKLTREQKQALFKAHSEVEAKRVALRTKLTELDGAVSAKVKDIYDACGTGPFKYGPTGDTVTISRRGDTYFFKGLGYDNVETI